MTVTEGVAPSSYRDSQTQLICLKITHSILERLTAEQLLTWLPIITACDGGPPSRLIVNSIMMWVYDTYCEEKGTDTTEIMNIARLRLIKGLTDPTLTNR